MKLQKRWVESSSWKLCFAGIKLPWCFPQNIPARGCPDKPSESTAGGEIKDMRHPILLTRTSLPLHHMHTQPLLAFFNIPSLLSCCCNRTPDCHKERKATTAHDSEVKDASGAAGQQVPRILFSLSPLCKDYNSMASRLRFLCDC